MAIKPYVKNDQTCFLIRCVKKCGAIRVQREVDLGAVSRAEARREHCELKRRVAADFEQKRNQGLTWRHLLAKFHRAEILGKPSDTTTRIDHYNALHMHTKDWMATPVTQLNTTAVQILFCEMRTKGLSRSRIKSIRGAINMVFDWAAMERVIPATIASPARGAALPKVKADKQPVLNREEIKLLLRRAQELGHEYYPVWAMAASTGCRSGELWALRWTDVDFSRAMISVTKSFSGRLGRDKSTKSGEWREVPISPELETSLKELKLITGSSGYVLPRITSWRRGDASKVLRDFCRQIGVREINFHALRSCFAIQCLETGIDVARTMKLGGWTSMKSFQHYIRLAGVEVRGATDSFNLLPTPNAGATVHELKRTAGFDSPVVQT